MTGRRAAGVIAVALAVTAALGATTIVAGAGAAGTREIRIDIRYSRFTPQLVEVAPGETVRFVLVNRDPIAHEFIVGDLGVQLAHERGTEARHPPRPGEITIPAATTRPTTITFDPDPAARHTLFGCHLPGHYAYGMAGAIGFA